MVKSINIQNTRTSNRDTWGISSPYAELLGQQEQLPAD